jgi:hypothetical protein
MAATRHPVIYGPSSGTAHAKSLEPLGHATTARGALAVAHRRLMAPLRCERRVVKLVTHPDLGEGTPEVTVWSVAEILKERR